MRKYYSFFIGIIFCSPSIAQLSKSDSTKIKNEIKDSLFIAETENVKGKDKVLHAEPLFIDLIRDLGARKGEREWNVAVGMTDQKRFDSYTALVEYEFAPINRLGLEVELPFTFYYPTDSTLGRNDVPQSKLNSLKLAAQYSFYVSEKKSTSLAIGYIHEFELTSFNKYGSEKLLKGNIYNPFLVGAKRWGDNFHTLVYTGPVLTHNFNTKRIQSIWQINTSFHYMIPGTRNFIGIETNIETSRNNTETILRPQMRIGIADNIMIGIVTGIPIVKENQRLSSFMRLIYEPKHRTKKA